MVVKVYISRVSGDKEIKHRQQTLLQTLDTKKIYYELIDIAEEGNEEKKEFMQKNSTSFGSTLVEPDPGCPLPPQIFNDDHYCGDYQQFEIANENKELDIFLKIVPVEAQTFTSTVELKITEDQD